ncbi:macrophage mannose receptor 1-like isoform X2 [Nelusetta ayraudi]|uniref:macrophage mannose receptor 1-like isoform X2 n=1 Tax=Nelusetta ayraudi TaxID=303726 RepID=UPI003F71DC03
MNAGAFSALAFSAARERCQKDHTDLAVVRNAEDLSELNSTMRRPIAWIGLRADTASWRWSEANVVVRPQPRLSESAGVQFTNWESGKPGDALHQSCAAVNSRGKWMDENCQEMYSFICYRDNAQNSSRFVPNLNKFNWMDAQTYCRWNYKDLAIVRDSAENAEIASMIPSEPFWIGLYRDSWKWVDGSPLTFENWGQNAPNTQYADACAAATVNGVWLNQKCGGGLPYVCHKKPGKKVSVVKVVLKKTDSPVDLEELNILQQVNQTLVSHGLTDVKLKWRKLPDGKIFHKKEEKEKHRHDKKEDCDLIP